MLAHKNNIALKNNIDLFILGKDLSINLTQKIITILINKGIMKNKLLLQSLSCKNIITIKPK